MAKVPLRLYLIHLFLMLSPAISATAIYFIIFPEIEEHMTTADQVRVFKIFAAAMAVIGVSMAQLVPRYMTRGTTSIPMARFVSLKIVQWALLEASAMAMVAVFFASRDKTLLIPLGVLIAIIAVMRPTVDELVHHGVKN